MKKIYKILIIMCCISLYFIVGKHIVYAESNNIDYESISNELAKDVKKYHIPGMSIVVVNSNEILFSETYGNCNNINTPFIIGSMSKSFTALSIMKLVEENKIDLDKPISTYIDTSIYFKNKEDGDKITVKQLLNQNSGLGTYQKLGNAKITNNYGKYEYANINYNLLGKIVESVSNENYADYVTKNIFIPLKMDNSSATLEGSKANGLIKGYRNYFGIPIAGNPDYPTDNSWSQVSAGYISSSALDIGKYLQMYLNGGSEIISQDSINKMFYDYISQDDTDLNYYGMGWVYTKQFSKPIFMHSGLVENYTSNMFIIPESNIGIVVLVNTNDYLVTNNLLSNTIMPLLGEEKQEMSGNPYIRTHTLINIIYFIITIIAIYPIITINRWKKKDRTKFMLVIDIIRHIFIPIILILIPTMIKIPIWVIWYFVKDLCMVLIINTMLMILTGIYKVSFVIRNNNLSFGLGEKIMSKYIKLNIIPIIIEIVFILSCFIIPKEYFIYTNFLFYSLLLIYFCIEKEISLKEWLNNIKSGKKFWKQVIITVLFFILAFIITTILENIFPNYNAGTIALKRDTWLKLIIFAISTILLPAITEETFYRKNMISFKSKGILLLTTILGMFLYALEHSLTIWGIFLTMIWALPLTISYIKTKNIYVPMTAHFIGNLLGNGIDVIMTVISML